MPGSSPLYALPYPLATDTVSSMDETIRALVDRLELVLAAANQPPLTPSDFASVVASITAFGAGPVAVPTPFAASSGWTIAGSLWAWQRMRFCSIQVGNNTGAALPIAATGIVTGAPVVATVAAGHRPNTYVTGWAQGAYNGARLFSNGQVALLQGLPSGTIPTGTTITYPFVYLAA